MQKLFIHINFIFKHVLHNYLYNQCYRVMETGDHFKNGASPKSQMSRGNIKQKSFLLFSALCYSIPITLAQGQNEQPKESYTIEIVLIVLLAFLLLGSSASRRRTGQIIKWGGGIGAILTVILSILTFGFFKGGGKDMFK